VFVFVYEIPYIDTQLIEQLCKAGGLVK